MKLRILTALLTAILAGACGSAAGPSPEPTAEIQVEATAEATASNPSWSVVRPSSPSVPGWEYQHPEGWTTVTLDSRNFFLYSLPTIGEHLFTSPIQPGEIAFQVSLNVAQNPEETVSSHLSVLTGVLRSAAFGEPQPISIGGMQGVQQSGVNESLGWTVIAVSREFVSGQFIDVFAYTPTDELELNLPVINTVIETVRYVLPTE